MKIEVDQNLCIGCGICTSICPEVFEISDETGKAFAKDVECECDLDEAVQGCPEQAITEEG